MSELIQIYNQEGEFLYNQDRKNFIEEQKKYFYENNKVQFAAGSVGLFLYNSEGKIYLVKRGKTSESSFQYDKSVGGHMNIGENSDTTVKRESIEEIGVDLIVAKDEEEYQRLLNIVDLTKKSVIKIVENIPWLGVDIKTKNPGESGYERRFNATVYIGKYDGELRYNDGEAIGRELMNINEVFEDIKINPEKYTESLIEMLLRYKKIFEDFITKAK